MPHAAARPPRFSVFSPRAQLFRLVPRTARQQRSSHDIKPAVFCPPCFTSHFQAGSPPEEMSLGALGITSAVPAVARTNTCSLQHGNQKISFIIIKNNTNNSKLNRNNVEIKSVASGYSFLKMRNKPIRCTELLHLDKLFPAHL